MHVPSSREGSQPAQADPAYAADRYLAQSAPCTAAILSCGLQYAEGAMADLAHVCVSRARAWGMRAVRGGRLRRGRAKGLARSADKRTARVSEYRPVACPPRLFMLFRLRRADCSRSPSLSARSWTACGGSVEYVLRTASKRLVHTAARDGDEHCSSTPVSAFLSSIPDPGQVRASDS